MTRQSFVARGFVLALVMVALTFSAVIPGAAGSGDPGTFRRTEVTPGARQAVPTTTPTDLAPQTSSGTTGDAASRTEARGETLPPTDVGHGGLMVREIGLRGAGRNPAAD